MAERKPEIVFKQADFSKLKVIESLDDFPLWSTRVKANLLSAGLWDEKLSVPTTTNEATSLLLSLVADQFLTPLMDQNLTAPLIWTTLNSLYHVSNLSTKVTSLNQLISFHFKAQLCSLIEACFKRRKEKSLRLLEAPLPWASTNSSCYSLWLTCLLPTLLSALNSRSLLLMTSRSLWTHSLVTSCAKRAPTLPHSLIVFIVRLLFCRFLALPLVLMAAVKNPASLALPPHVLSAPSVRILVKPSSFTVPTLSSVASNENFRRKMTLKVGVYRHPLHLRVFTSEPSSWESSTTINSLWCTSFLPWCHSSSLPRLPRREMQKRYPSSAKPNSRQSTWWHHSWRLDWSNLSHQYRRLSSALSREKTHVKSGCKRNH